MTTSQLLPVFSSKLLDAARKAYLLPGIATILVAVISFVLLNDIGNAQTRGEQVEALVKFGLLLSAYLAIFAMLYIYRMCGKVKPAWVLVAVALATIALTRVWGSVNGIECRRERLLQGLGSSDCPMPIVPIADPRSDGFIEFAFKMLVSAAIPEELIKALPLVLLAWAGTRMSSRLGLREPLDGLLLGAASGAGFTIFETGWAYVPNNGEFGLGLLLPRVIGALGGHMAYSGIVGYGIGLAELKPRRRRQIIGTSYAGAVALHTSWNALAYRDSMVLTALQFMVGALSFTWLVSAILKARQLSPTRAQNFATQVAYSTPARADAPPAARPDLPPQTVPPIDTRPPVDTRPPIDTRPPVVTPPVAKTPPAAPTKPATRARYQLVCGRQALALAEGGTLRESDLVGLASARGDGIVARVSANPADATVLGLTNLSTSAWSIRLANGERRELPVEKTIRLAPGTSIDFGVLRGEVRDA